MAKLTQPPTLAQRWLANLEDHIIAVAWSPDGSTLAAASIAGPIVLFDASSGNRKHDWNGHGFGTTHLAWQPNGKLLASTGQDGKVRLWDTQAGKEAIALDAGAAWVERVAWSPRGDILISAAGKKMRAWNDRGELLRVYPDQPSTIADVSWAPKAREFAVAGYGGVSFFNTDSDEQRTRFDWKGSVLTVAWSPDAKFIAGGAQNCSVHFWYMKSGKDLEMTGYPLKVRELSWDFTSTYLATGGGNLVTVWDCTGKGPAGSTPISLELHEEPLAALAFQSRGPMLASGCEQGILALWFPGSWKRALTQAKFASGISQLAWSPSNTRLAVGGDSGAVAVYAV